MEVKEVSHATRSENDLTVNQMPLKPRKIDPITSSQPTSSQSIGVQPTTITYATEGADPELFQNNDDIQNDISTLEQHWDMEPLQQHWDLYDLDAHDLDATAENLPELNLNAPNQGPASTGSKSKEEEAKEASYRQ